MKLFEILRRARQRSGIGPAHGTPRPWWYDLGPAPPVREEWFSLVPIE